MNLVLDLLFSYSPNIIGAGVGVVLSLVLIRRRGSVIALFGFIAMFVAVGIGTGNYIYLTRFASTDSDTVMLVNRVLLGAADVVALGSWALIIVALVVKSRPEPATKPTTTVGAAQPGWPAQPAGSAAPAFGTQPAAGTASGFGGQPAGTAPAPSGFDPAQPPAGGTQPGAAQPVGNQPGNAQPGNAQPGFGQPGFGQPGFGQLGSPQPGSGAQPGFGGPAGDQGASRQPGFGSPGEQNPAQQPGWGQPGGGPSPY